MRAIPQGLWRNIEQLELPLWDLLKDAAIDPDAANVGQLLDGLDQALSDLDTVGQLQVAAAAIDQIVQVFEQRSTLAFEELAATNSDDGPVMAEDAFDRYVRQTMEVNFELFIEPIEPLSRKVPERLFIDGESIVGEIDPVALLQALDEQMGQEPGLTEAEAFNRAIETAHDEDMSNWAKAIEQALAQRQGQAIRLLDLQRVIGLPLVPIWLAALLGEFGLEQRSTFYDIQGMWVFCPNPVE